MTKVIIDSNIFIALSNNQDPQRQKALNIYKRIRVHKAQQIINNYVVAEIATVLLVRTKDVNLSASTVQNMYNSKQGLSIEQFKKRDQLKTLQLFSKQTSPKLSFTDCTILFQSQKYNCPIATLDKDLAKAAGNAIKI